mgnify:CR=1 FL=1
MAMENNSQNKKSINQNNKSLKSSDIHKVLNEKNYVTVAEGVIKLLSSMSKDNRNGKIEMVTNSKIRNLLSMSANIYNEIMVDTRITDDKLPDDLNGKIEYLRVRFVYEAGRENKVKQLVEKADLIELLKTIRGSKRRYELFYHYMEALVAFKKFYNDNDD